MKVFELLRQSKKASQQAIDNEGRAPFFNLGIVTDNQDPVGKRRIKVTLQNKGGKTNTDWLTRLLASPYDDPPIPRIGQTVGVLFVDGNPNNGVYFGSLTNQTNTERTLTNPIEDDGRLIEGDRKVTINQDDLLTVNGSVTINADGSVTITAPTITLNGDVRISGSGQINGKEIMVIGGIDSDGDTMTSSGQ